MKEMYANMERLLEKICDHDHEWNICADLKVVALLTIVLKEVSQGAAVSFVSGTVGRGRSTAVKQWPSQRSLIPGEKGVLHPALVDPSEIYLPPPHIKLGLMEVFLKGMDKNGPAFTYLMEKFPRVTEAKIKEGTQ